ncbi:ComEA family DNA-binding protein [Leeuwenhoekiella marinoflava]|uniref:DNA uptake protein ComE-like DNA-binding protein n=2 Tax=Leeuwenhoekiella marinoflava TaxID=988 RepID=A0A4Q0PIW5_9FLAO|nr:helix-hairpin-helix domain-containing protein [Leeuwenhoekiella marinoflava]RXG27064.1 DNA uptake protein ComE-like DNA-binding protein [Leeuwenhoekiella marinoflava]SHF43384.1 DNA uptake protein ComE [Leeuwenhoekiella marinoflava DSM 3653]
MNLKSHFFLDNRQRSGILLLVLILVASWGVYFLITPDTSYKSEALTNEELQVFEARIDSLRRIKLAASQPKIFPFNPNFITDYKGYTLGMSLAEIDKLLRFREKDQWINSAEDFQNVTGVSDSLLQTISPYFKFPEWVTNSKPKASKFSFASAEEKPKSDLNKADFASFTQIEGLDEAIAKRVLSYRKRLGGFLEDNQLYDIYGISKSQVYAIKDRFTVQSKPEIKLIDVNSANASDLSTVPFITFEIARDIIDYRVLHEGINNLDELLKIDGISAYKLERIKLYLSSNQN